jgi:hypothetical protein
VLELEDVSLFPEFGLHWTLCALNNSYCLARLPLNPAHGFYEAGATLVILGSMSGSTYPILWVSIPISTSSEPGLQSIQFCTHDAPSFFVKALL